MKNVIGGLVLGGLLLLAGLCFGSWAQPFRDPPLSCDPSVASPHLEPADTTSRSSAGGVCVDPVLRAQQRVLHFGSRASLNAEFARLAPDIHLVFVGTSDPYCAAMLMDAATRRVKARCSPTQTALRKATLGWGQS